jgi:hypothetical protein
MRRWPAPRRHVVEEGGRPGGHRRGGDHQRDRRRHPQLRAVHPALFTHQWNAFADLMRPAGGWTGIQHDLFLQVAWALVFGFATWARFTTKDVLA